MNPNESLTHGAFLEDERSCRFSVWAPNANSIDVRITSPEDQLFPLKKNSDGFFEGTLAGISAGATYFYRINGASDRPDPASRYQPDTVHGPSQIVYPHYKWSDKKWKGIPLEDHIIYELHVGTFTSEGTFEAIVPRLGGLKKIGITAIEIMPVSQFPGGRNWGYDGVYPFAVQNTYGGPEGLKKLVNACHGNGIAVIMDVVYNHLGPEGNYLNDYGPYFTDRYRTPWGLALNFDGPDSDPVRRFFIENAIMWIRDFHIDALRLDAIHAIRDFSAHPFLLELEEAIRGEGSRQGRAIHLFPESDLNDTRIIRPKSQGGFNHDAQWMDDYHHVIHTLLTGENKGYYADFRSIQQLETSLKEGYVYSGGYSLFRRRRFGNKSKDLEPSKFIVCAQNHDQIGNRMMGDRLTETLSFEQQKLAAGLVILSPYIPLLFMGEEYGETAPFLYFTSHGDQSLVEAVRKGRKEEFATFAWKGEVPDPQSEATFLKSKLNPNLKNNDSHSILLKFYTELIQLRKSTPALHATSRTSLKVGVVKGSQMIWTHRSIKTHDVFCLFNFEHQRENLQISLPKGSWTRTIDSADATWKGPGSQLGNRIKSDGKLKITVNPDSFVVLKKKR
jgi:maltooligosyltrehalose trehalohydrolase